MSQLSLNPYADTSERTLAVTAVISFFLSLSGWGVARLTVPEPEMAPPASLTRVIGGIGLNFTPRHRDDLIRWVQSDPQVLFVRMDWANQKSWQYPASFDPPAWTLLPPSWAASICRQGEGVSIDIIDLSREGRPGSRGLAPSPGRLGGAQRLGLGSTPHGVFMPALRRVQAQLFTNDQLVGEMTVIYEPLLRVRNAGWDRIHSAARRAFLLFGLLYWVLVPLWVFLDARSRGEQGAGWGLLCLLANLAGLIAYLIFRSQAHPTCDRCGRPLQHGYLLCPYCGPREPEQCPTCDGVVERDWKWCPRCAGPLLRSSP